MQRWLGRVLGAFVSVVLFLQLQIAHSKSAGFVTMFETIRNTTELMASFQAPGQEFTMLDMPEDFSECWAHAVCPSCRLAMAVLQLRLLPRTERQAASLKLSDRRAFVADSGEL